MLGERIRYHRKREKLTQEELAEGICSVTYLSKVENGAKASEEILQLLCKRLDISYEAVDNEKLIQEVSNQLNDWYTKIKHQSLEKAEEQRKKIKEKIEFIDDPVFSLKYRLFEARYYFGMGDFKTGKTLLDEVLKVRELFNKELYFFFYHFAGVYEYLSGNFSTSKEYLDKAEAITEELALPETELAELYYQLSRIYNVLFYTSSSISYGLKALKTFNKEYHFNRSAECHILLGINYRRIRNYDQSEYHYENALKLARSIKDKETEKLSYHNLGYLYSCQNKSEGAIAYYKQSLKFESNYVRSIYLLAKEYYKQGKIKNAKRWLEKGQNLPKTKRDKNYQYHFQILNHHLSNDLSEKYETLLKDEAIPFFKESRQWELVAEHEENLGNYYFNHHQYKNAALHYQQALEAKKKMID